MKIKFITEIMTFNRYNLNYFFLNTTKIVVDSENILFNNWHKILF
jgi:hypothetical protein